MIPALGADVAGVTVDEEECAELKDSSLGPEGHPLGMTARRI